MSTTGYAHGYERPLNEGTWLVGVYPSHMGFREERYRDVSFAEPRMQSEARIATENPCVTGITIRPAVIPARDWWIH